MPHCGKRIHAFSGAESESRAGDTFQSAAEFPTKEFGDRATGICSDGYGHDFVALAFQSLRRRDRLSHVTPAIALHGNKPQDCLKWCREALRGKGRAEAAEVLRLMAGAYEQTGERDKMIRCLAGELPN